MDILKYPGNLGGVRGSILTVHHYDWPTYPQGEDFRETLFRLTAFPFGTRFLEVEDGDRSILFVADVRGSQMDDPYHRRNFHICAWHEDLIEMNSRGLITGVTAVTENAHECARWERVLRENQTDTLFVKIDDEYREVPAPVREPDDEDDDRDWALLREHRVSVTHAGVEFIAGEIMESGVNFERTLSPLVSKLMDSDLYDTAVREACVTLESSIKAKLASDKYGDRLTGDFLKHLREDDDRLLESSLRDYEQELRTVFKLIRNVYAHNLKSIDRATATVLLFRVSRVNLEISRQQ